MKKNNFYRLANFVLNSHIKSKLMWVYFILILLPMGVFTVFTFMRVSNTLQAQTLASSQKTVDDIFLSTQLIIDQLDNTLDILTQDPMIYRMSTLQRKDYPVIEQFADTQQLAEKFSSLKIMSNVDAIRLYVDNSMLYSGENKNIFSLDSVRDSNWHHKLMLSDEPTLWLSPNDFADQPEKEQDYFSSVRIIYNPDAIMSPLAILRVDIQLETLQKAFKTTPITEHATAILLKDGQPLLLSGFVPQDKENFVDFSMLSNLQEQEWNFVDLHGRENFVRTQKLAHTGWTVATIVPIDDIYQVSRSLLLEMILVMLVVGIIAYFIAYAISHSTIRRITLLAQSMKTVQEGHIDVRIAPLGEDEIGLLMSGFNDMMTRMDGLMDEKYEFGIKIKNLELQALQAQINPHFLYNSLDLINCLAIRSNVPEITAMVSALARFYKISLSRGHNQIPLRDELSHARLYIQIQNLRFEDRITTQWEIDESLLDYPVIKIVLQPIIENSIIHGIFESSSKAGVLLIRCFRCKAHDNKEDICIEITDNGVGMDKKTIQANFTPGPLGSIAETSGGYGVRNIQDRLRLAYGADYGLSCTSAPDKGTTVTIRFPMLS